MSASAVEQIQESDAQIIEEMAEVVVRNRIGRKDAQKYAFMWLCIFAAFEGANISDVLDRFAKSAPSRHDQRDLIARLNRRVDELR